MSDIDNAAFFTQVRELLSEGREVVFTPKGNSMLPFIRGGRDSVVLSGAFAPLEVGDIVLADVDGRFVMHRVFALEGDSVTLMGDGNITGTESCTVADVIGKVTEIRKDAGKTVKPGKGRLWRVLMPVRRYILAIYKRVFK